MIYRVTHSTQYLYSTPVALCRNEACLLPRETPRQKCLSSKLQIEPESSDLRERTDFWGNRVTHFAIQNPHKKLQVTAISDVETSPADPNLLLAGNQLAWETMRQRLARERNPEALDALPCRHDSPFIKQSPQLEEYARPSFSPDRPLADAVSDLMQRIYRDFTYDPGVTTIATPLSEVMETRRGVCQDFAHLGIGCLRAMGLAARYVSGYLETLPPPGKERLVGADASHAWFSVYAADAGWIDFDPTNNQIAAEQHITVAWGRDFSDVSPLRGVALGGGKPRMVVSVDVARVPVTMGQFQSQST
ncbi:MAG: transglutaminase family protein [Desulfuromusa sp.]|jgi:transglutaminase-like putative cysteine protease|nr:transglutaminase family protein [Desulfuromusa sp.]